MKNAKKYKKQAKTKKHEINIEMINSEIIAYYNKYVANNGVTEENQKFSTSNRNVPGHA